MENVNDEIIFNDIANYSSNSDSSPTKFHQIKKKLPTMEILLILQSMKKTSATANVRKTMCITDYIMIN